MGKTKIFSKGDVIRTNPEKSFYGIAVVLNEGTKLKLPNGKESYPMCHIAITPLIFQHEIMIDDININELEVLVFDRNAKRSDGVTIPWRVETCVNIYTNRNKANLTVIGNINPSGIYSEPLVFAPQNDRFFLCGDVDDSLGREAYIAYKIDIN